MEGVIFVGLVALVLVWLVARRGRVRARNLTSRVSTAFSGHYVGGGLLGSPRMQARMGEHLITMHVRPVSWVGTQFQVALSAPWPGDRPTLTPGRPNALLIPCYDSDGSPAKRPLSADLGRVAEQFIAVPVIGNEQIWTERKELYMTATLQRYDLPALKHWFQYAAMFHRYLLAETDTSMVFSTLGGATDPASIVCQVCGVPPEPDERVHCSACGAPHHLECWSYNGGCAIYGCRCQEFRRPNPAGC